MDLLAGSVLALALVAWSTDARTDQRVVARLADAARAGRTDEVLTGAAGQPPEVLDVLAQSAACGARPDLLRALVDRGARPKIFATGALWCLLGDWKESVPGAAPRAGVPVAAETVQLLVSAGADVRARFARGRSILQAAAETCAPELIDPILDAGADPNTGHADAPLKRVMYCRADLVSTLLAHGAQADVGRGFGPVDALCRAPLDARTFRARLAALMAHGAREAALRGSTLVGAASGGTLVAVEGLLAAGADPNGRDGEGRTPLHAVAQDCWNACEAKIGALLGAGADPKMRVQRTRDAPTGFQALTPYELAARSGQAPLLGDLLASLPWAPLGPGVATATASGALVEPGRPADFYAASRAVDGRTSTCWCVRVPGLPNAEDAGMMEGEENPTPRPAISVQLHRPARVLALRVYPGCTERREVFVANNRVAALRIEGGGQQTYVHLLDAMRYQDVGFSTPAPVDRIRLVIDGVTRGSKYDDTCIAEIQAVLE